MSPYTKSTWLRVIWLELEADRFMNLSYSKSDFQTEAGAVYGEYRKNRTSPFFTIYEAVHKAAFTRHTYGHTAMGFEQDIQAMPSMYSYSKRFFSRNYRPENAVLVVAGDITPEAVNPLVDQHYAAWKRGYRAPQITPEPEQKEERRIHVQYEGQTLPILWVAYKGEPYAPSDRTYVASVLLAELAFGPTSRLYQDLKLERRLVQSLSASAAEDRDPGLWSVFTQVRDPKQVETVLSAIDTEIEKLKSGNIDPQALADTKSHMRYGFVMNLDTPADVVEKIASVVGISGTTASIEQFYATLAQVQVADVQAAAKRYLNQQQRTIAVLEGQ